MYSVIQAQSVAEKISRLMFDIRLSQSNAFEDWVKAMLNGFIGGDNCRDHLSWRDREATKAVEAEKLFFGFVESYPGIDLLGRVMCELNLAGHSKNLGAFYTPYSVSKAIAQMQFHDLKLDNYPDGFSVLEPCVGAGSMALAVVETLFENYGQAGLDKLRLTINDIDRCAVYCATIQLLKTVEVLSPAKSLRELIVYCGNALTVEHELLYHITAMPIRPATEELNAAVELSSLACA